MQTAALPAQLHKDDSNFHKTSFDLCSSLNNEFDTEVGDKLDSIPTKNEFETVDPTKVYYV